VGYVGTISRARGFPDFIEIVNYLRGEGLVIDLVINGSNPENIHLGSFPWVRLHELQSFESFSELLGTFDVGVIPYVDKEYWDYMSITKMATYMAAGLPILSMQLTETSNILAKWNCGVSVKDWSDMAVALKQLCEDRSLIERLGRNSRRAAVEEYNWAKQAEKLGRFLEDLVTNGDLGNQQLDRKPTRSDAHYHMARKATKLASRQSVG
jgi:glycosyltransferase involved in cell wall biosynthesis